MAIKKRSSSHARDLRQEVSKRIPECRKFVSKFWQVDECLAEPKKITVEETSNNGPPGYIRAPTRELVLFAGNFKRANPDRLEHVLIHELTHLVTVSFMDMAKNESRCVAEGLASLATDAYFSQEREYSVDKILYFRGKRFVRALYDGGITPAQMHPMFRTWPRINELFVPSTYLERMGVPYNMNRDSDAIDIRDWVKYATVLGRVSFKNGVVYSGQGAKLKILGFLLGHKVNCGNLSMPRGLPEHLLHNPAMYGLQFITKLAKYLKSLDRALSIVNKYPPVDLMSHPKSVAHIIEPYIYIIKVQMRDSSLQRF